MTRKSQKGFTLIELLVVIAIIGILSAIVLASLGTARNKGNNAKIETQISQIRAAAEVYSSNHSGSYVATYRTDDVCNPQSGDPSDLYNLLAGTNYPQAVAPTCNVASDGSAWEAYHILTASTTQYACADSSGKSEIFSSSTPTIGLSCP